MICHRPKTAGYNLHRGESEDALEEGLGIATRKSPRDCRPKISRQQDIRCWRSRNGYRKHTTSERQYMVR